MCQHVMSKFLRRKDHYKESFLNVSIAYLISHQSATDVVYCAFFLASSLCANNAPREEVVAKMYKIKGFPSMGGINIGVLAK